MVRTASEVAARTRHHAVLVVIHGAAHAINFSHAAELANVIRQFMDDQPIVDDPAADGVAKAYEIDRADPVGASYGESGREPLQE